MALDRWIALCFLVLCLLYGYSAFFTMDASLPPFLRHNPVWPSTFPKFLAVIGIIAALVVLFKLEPTNDEPSSEIDWQRWREYDYGKALLLLALMAAYALGLHTLGFLLSTFSFLGLSAWLLGERKPWPLLAICAAASGLIWYLVEQVLGIYLRALPSFF